MKISWVFPNDSFKPVSSPNWTFGRNGRYFQNAVVFVDQRSIITKVRNIFGLIM